jgi:leucyl-tRNA synthetase
MEFTNFLTKEEKVDKTIWDRFLLVISPFAPFVSEELWERLGNSYSIHMQKWPTYDEEKIQNEEIEIVVQINGKLRDTIKIHSDADQREVEEKARESQKVLKYLAKKPKKVIFVKGKIINFVV